jgi:hypothetical protein
MLTLSNAQLDLLLANGRLQATARGTAREYDFRPVLKLFTPDAAATWLISELDPDDGDTLFGLCDLGLGCPELGSISLRELSTIRGKFGLSVEVDRYFKPDRPLSAYADEARANGHIRV